MSYGEVVRKNGCYKLIGIPYQGTCLKISKIHKYFVYGSRDGNLVVYDREKKTVLLDVGFGDVSLWTVFMSDDEKFIVTGGDDRVIHRISFPEGQKLASLTGHTGEVNHCVMTKNNLLLYSASGDGTVRVWNWRTLENKILLDHSKAIYAFDLSNDEKYIISGDSGGDIRCLEIGKNSFFTVNSGHSVWCLRFSPDGFYFVSGSSVAIDVWTSEGGHLREIKNRHGDRIRCIDYCHNSEMFATAGNDHLIKFWKSFNFQEEVTFDIHSDWILGICYDEDSATWNSISEDCSISVVTVPQAQRGYFVSEICSIVVYLSSLKHLIFYGEKELKLCDLVDGEIVHRKTCKEFFDEMIENYCGRVLTLTDNKIRKISPLSLEFEDGELEFCSGNIILGSRFILDFSREYIEVFDSQNLEGLFRLQVSIDKSKVALYNEKILIHNEQNVEIYNEKKSEILFEAQKDVYCLKLVNDELVVMLKNPRILITYSIFTKIKQEAKLDCDKAEIYCRGDMIYAVTFEKVFIYSLYPLCILSTVVFSKRISDFIICNDLIAVRNVHAQLTVYKDFDNTYIQLDGEYREGMIQMN